jgi:serine/threonine protein kinase
MYNLSKTALLRLSRRLRTHAYPQIHVRSYLVGSRIQQQRDVKEFDVANISKRLHTSLGLAFVMISMGWNSERDAKSRSIEHDAKKRWLLYDEIGSGAFGKVRLGMCQETGEMAAVKIVKPDKRNFSSLEREISALKRIQSFGGHKNIIELMDVYVEGGKMCLVTELVKGGELYDHVIAHGTFDEESARGLVKDVCEALGFIHHIGLVHKDVKPENILLSSNMLNKANTVKLADFGSAGPVESHSKRDDFGTSAYLPPEAIISGVCTTACDMWAVGCVLYIVLSGVHPFDLRGISSNSQVELNIRFGEVSFEYPTWARVSSEAKDLIRRLLNKDPALRPSAEDVLNHPWLLEK